MMRLECWTLGHRNKQTKNTKSIVWVSYCFCNKLPWTQWLIARLYHGSFVDVRIDNGFHGAETDVSARFLKALGKNVFFGFLKLLELLTNLGLYSSFSIKNFKAGNSWLNLSQYTKSLMLTFMPTSSFPLKELCYYIALTRIILLGQLFSNLRFMCNYNSPLPCTTPLHILRLTYLRLEHLWGNIILLTTTIIKNN